MKDTTVKNSIDTRRIGSAHSGSPLINPIGARQAVNTITPTLGFGDIFGSGVVGRVAEFITDSVHIHEAKLIAPTANVLTLTASAASTLALAISSGKTLTLTTTDSFNLTIPATGTTALLGIANVFTVAQTINLGLVVNDNGDAAGDLRAESDNQTEMLLLDASADILYFGGTTNGTRIAANGSLSQIGTARIAWTKITAASVTITVGGTDASSVVANLQTAGDGNFFHLDEVAAAPALNFYVEFTGVTAFNWVRILAYYAGSATHALALQLYNWGGTTWDTFNALQNGAGDVATVGGYILDSGSFIVPVDTAYIGTAGNAGKVRVRFYHTMTGNSSHDIYVDTVELYQ